jgi:integrase/recombinase XerD
MPWSGWWISARNEFRLQKLISGPQAQTYAPGASVSKTSVQRSREKREKADVRKRWRPENSTQEYPTTIDIEDVAALLYTLKGSFNRHRAAPLIKEREEFLAHLLRRGLTVGFVKYRARALRTVLQLLKMTHLRTVRPIDIERAIKKYLAMRRKRRCKLPGFCTAKSTRNVAFQFFKFHRRLKPLGRYQPFRRYLNEFTAVLEKEYIAPATVRMYRDKVSIFLRWYATHKKALRSVSHRDVNKYMAVKKAEGRATATLAGTSHALRAFLRCGGKHGWCREGLAEGILVPRCSHFAQRRQGREWVEVRRVLRSLVGKDHASVRAKAVVSLIATYALRAGEVTRLRAEDFDWKKQILVVRRSKNGPPQRYFLTPTVRRNVLRYVRIRPACACDRLFVTLQHPHRPIATRSITALTYFRFEKIGVTSGPRGPHSIRHAKATQLLRQGKSMKRIGEFLGHTHPDSPLHYAKYNLRQLREVAEVSLEGLM